MYQSLILSNIQCPTIYLQFYTQEKPEHCSYVARLKLIETSEIPNLLYFFLTAHLNHHYLFHTYSSLFLQTAKPPVLDTLWTQTLYINLWKLLYIIDGVLLCWVIGLDIRSGSDYAEKGVGFNVCKLKNDSIFMY